MRTSTRMIVLACAAVSGPLLASAAIGVRDYVTSSGEADEDGFSLDGDGVFVGSSALTPSNGTITVTGTRPPRPPPPRNPPPTWTFGWGDGCGGSDSGCGGGDGGGDPPSDLDVERLDCEKDNLAYDLAAVIKPSLPTGRERGAILSIRWVGSSTVR